MYGFIFAFISFFLPHYDNKSSQHGRLRQEDGNFKASLDQMPRSSLTINVKHRLSFSKCFKCNPHTYVSSVPFSSSSRWRKWGSEDQISCSRSQLINDKTRIQISATWTKVVFPSTAVYYITPSRYDPTVNLGALVTGGICLIFF